MEHYERIKRYISYKAGADQAEDLTQQVFLKANEHMDSFRNESSLYTWLHSIATNTIINEAARSYHSKELLVDGKYTHSRFVTTDFTKEVDFQIDLGTSLSKLDQIDQEILTLRYVADYSFRDIAKILKLNEGMIKVRLYRCLGKMKNDLDSWHVATPFNPKQYIIMVHMLEKQQGGQEVEQVTDDLLHEFRNNFKRITTALNYTPKQKVPYEIYPDKVSLNEALCNPSYSNIIGSPLNQKVQMVSPLNPGPYSNYKTVVRCSMELYAGVLVRQINPGLPRWLTLGVGMYVGFARPRDVMQKRLHSIFLENNGLPSFEQIRGTTSDSHLSGSDRNNLSYTMIDFIITRYSLDVLHRLIREPSNYEGIFQRTLVQFEEDWLQFVKEQYIYNSQQPQQLAEIVLPVETEETAVLTLLLRDNASASVKYRNHTFQKHARLFEKQNPGVKVNIVKIPAETFWSDVTKRIEENKPADLIFGSYNPELARQGFFADLLPFYKADKMSPGDIFKPLTDLASVNGQLTGIPMSPQQLALVYNKDWFEKAGIAFPDETWTWEHFFKMTPQLQAAKQTKGKSVYGGTIALDVVLFESLIYSRGQLLVSIDRSKTTGYMNTREVAEAAILITQQLHSNKSIKRVENSVAASLTELTYNNTAMAIIRNDAYTFLEKDPKTTKGKFGVAPLPHLENGIRSNATYLNTISIANASVQKELAWDFVKSVIVNSDSPFHKDWAEQELLTSKAAIQKTGHNTHAGLKVLYDEMSYARKPILYENIRLSSLVNSRTLLPIIPLQTVDDMQAKLTEMTEQIDKQLSKQVP
jgi:RNA polymerase sigma-70 factor (ECF subfamily)